MDSGHPPDRSASDGRVGCGTNTGPSPPTPLYERLHVLSEV